jgi:hypothetical protein
MVLPTDMVLDSVMAGVKVPGVKVPGVMDLATDVDSVDMAGVMEDHTLEDLDGEVDSVAELAA